jgi:hypothetical protein
MNLESDSCSYKKPALNISFDVRMSPEHPATSSPFSILFINNNVLFIATARHNNNLKQNVNKPPQCRSVHVFFARQIARYWFHSGQNSVPPSADNSNPLATNVSKQSHLKPVAQLVLQSSRAVCGGPNTDNSYATWRYDITWYINWLRTGRPRGRSSSPGRGKIFLLSTSTRPVLGPTQPPIEWVPGALSPGCKAAGSWSWPLTTI